MYLIDGKEVSKKIRKEIKKEVENRELKLKLLVILVGDDLASKIYVKSKEKACISVGMESETIVFKANVSEKQVVEAIEKANKDKKITGILVQLPLPDHMNEVRVINTIDPTKDVDGLTYINQGKLFGKSESITPCTPKGIMSLFNAYNVNLSGKNAIVIGRSMLVGKPLAMLLLNENATVTIAHSRTKNLREICKTMDVIISAVGKPKVVTEDMVKEGAIVIDVGVNRVHNTIVGDVDYLSVCKKVERITPVPGGVGPMTIASLLQNLIICHDMRK